MPHPALKNVAKMVSKVFGEPAIKVDIDGVETPIRLIFQENYADFDFNGIQVNERNPVAWVQVSSGVDSRDLLRVQGTEYLIQHMEADGYGLQRLELGVA